MRKKACMAMVFWLAVMLLTGCGLIKIEEGERTPLEYTIVKQEEIPAEAVRFMEQKKKKGFQMIYKVEDSMYLMKGYGTQVTGGYSIQVEEVSQSENGVSCKTRLLSVTFQTLNSSNLYRLEFALSIPMYRMLLLQVVIRPMRQSPLQRESCMR